MSACWPWPGLESGAASGAGVPRFRPVLDSRFLRVWPAGVSPDRNPRRRSAWVDLKVWEGFNCWAGCSPSGRRRPCCQLLGTRCVGADRPGPVSALSHMGPVILELLSACLGPSRLPRALFRGGDHATRYLFCFLHGRSRDLFRQRGCGSAGASSGPPTAPAFVLSGPGRRTPWICAAFPRLLARRSAAALDVFDGTRRLSPRPADPARLHRAATAAAPGSRCGLVYTGVPSRPIRFGRRRRGLRREAASSRAGSSARELRGQTYASRSSVTRNPRSCRRPLVPGRPMMIEASAGSRRRCRWRRRKGLLHEARPGLPPSPASGPATGRRPGRGPYAQGFGAQSTPMAGGRSLRRGLQAPGGVLDGFGVHGAPYVSTRAVCGMRFTALAGGQPQDGVDAHVPVLGEALAQEGAACRNRAPAFWALRPGGGGLRHGPRPQEGPAPHFEAVHGQHAAHLAGLEHAAWVATTAGIRRRPPVAAAPACRSGPAPGPRGAGLPAAPAPRTPRPEWPEGHERGQLGVALGQQAGGPEQGRHLQDVPAGMGVGAGAARGSAAWAGRSCPPPRPGAGRPAQPSTCRPGTRSCREPLHLEAPGPKRSARMAWVRCSKNPAPRPPASSPSQVDQLAFHGLAIP